MLGPFVFPAEAPHGSCRGLARLLRKAGAMRTLLNQSVRPADAFQRQPASENATVQSCETPAMSSRTHVRARR